jgi:urease accessory protein
LLTTPAATKFYRSGGKLASQRQQVDARDAIVEWLPQETIFYRGATVRSETIIRLQSAAKFIGWEIPCFGMPARQETFDAGELRLNLELWRDEAPLLIDRMRICGSDESRTSPWGLGGHQAVGTLLAYPADGQAVELARSAAAAGAELAVTLVDGVLVCRCVAEQAETVKHLFIAIWQVLRPCLLGGFAAHLENVRWNLHHEKKTSCCCSLPRWLPNAARHAASSSITRKRWR